MRCSWCKPCSASFCACGICDNLSCETCHGGATRVTAPAKPTVIRQPKRARANKIIPAAYVKLVGVGRKKISELLHRLGELRIYPIGASSSGGPEGMYVAIHAAEELKTIRKIWRDIQNKYKENKL